MRWSGSACAHPCAYLCLCEGTVLQALPEVLGEEVSSAQFHSATRVSSLGLDVAVSRIGALNVCLLLQCFQVSESTEPSGLLAHHRPEQDFIRDEVLRHCSLYFMQDVEGVLYT